MFKQSANRRKQQPFQAGVLQSDLAWAGAHNPFFNNEKTRKGTKIYDGLLLCRMRSQAKNLLFVCYFLKNEKAI